VLRCQLKGQAFAPFEGADADVPPAHNDLRKFIVRAAVED